MSLMRAFCNSGLLAARSVAARTALTAARPSVVQASIQHYRTSSPMNVGARSALYRFDWDNGHNQEHHWKLERYLASALLVTLPAGIYFQHPAFDYLLAGIITIHSHMGMDQVVFDYLHYRPQWLYWYCMAWLYFWSTVAFCGLTYYTYAKNGLCGALKELWQVHANKPLWGSK